MKPLIPLSALFFTAITSLFLSGCFQSKSGIYEINPAFGQYISGYTSGMVSRKTTVRIELAESYYKSHPFKNVPAFTDSLAAAIYMASRMAELPDSSLLKDVFSFEPEIKGKAIWISDRIIEFIPDGPLPVNQFYNGKFRLGDLVDVPKDFKSFRFPFSSYPQNLLVDIDGLRAYDDYNIEWQKLTGTLKTSDYEDTAAVRKSIKVVQNGKLLPVNLTYGYPENEFYFYVDSIERKEHAGKVLVSWNGENIGATQKGSREIIVPALGDFTVLDARVIENEDQFVELDFSDPINYNQNLKGIVTIQGVENLSYAIEGNTVKVFLPGRIVGDKVIEVSTGIRNFKGYKMNTSYTSSLTFKEPSPRVRIKGNGTILPNSNGLIFPFESISLKAVDVRVIRILENNVHQFLQVNSLNGDYELTRVGKVIAEKKISLDYDKTKTSKQWNQHVIDLGKLIDPEPGAIYRVSIRFKKEYAICNCDPEPNADLPASDQPTDTEEDDKNWNERDWRRYGFDDGYDNWYGYNDDTSPCNDSYYYGKAVSRNILASDIGLIYKQDDNKLSHAFVTNMITARPLANAQIEYYDYAKQLIASGTSDANGMLDLPLKRKPFLLIAKYGKQRGYLKLLDGESNSLSKFDVDGEVVQKGVKGFIYGERGVWRPGDSLFLTFIMEDKEKRLPPNHPVKFELMDPHGQVVYQTTKTKNTNGMYDFRTATGDGAITGSYTAIAHVGNRFFQQSLKIETVKPNRLKIYMDFPNAGINDSTAKLSAKWLHGAIAKNLRTTVNVSVNQMKTSFDNYKSYVFDSPVRTFYSDANLIFDGNLNEQGEATIKTSLPVGQTAPGMLRATYITKVFEEGGDFSVDRYSKPYSPYKTYVGIHAPEQKGYDQAYETGRPYTFDVATVNAEGKAVSAKKLQVKIYKIEWRWWYEREEQELATYVSRTGSIVVEDTMINTTDGKGNFKFKINYPEYGRYLITVTDLEGGHETGQVVYMDWPYLSRANRSNNENANMLNFACDKEKYTTGENITLSFPSPSDGMALVSVESRTKVLKKFWVATKKGETIHRFPATADMSPNAFVHVSLIQPHASTKNDLPIRMYGVVPVMVDDPATHLFPQIRMADVIKPETTTSIHVSEKSGRKMTYSLAIVDEGLLDLTRFKTPQPWTTFYAREALGIKTWDMYDAVIGAYAGKLDKLLSLGGDGDGLGGKGVKANRFKPMVKFAGPFQLEAGAEKTHQVEIPNYVGSVRVMVVAEQDGAYGNAEKALAVRKPLMILATLPRVLGPGETVSLPVNVFAMEQQVKEVKIEIEVNDLLSSDGAKQQTLHFKQTGDEVINFKLNVAEKTGIAKVKITATSGKEKSVQEIELDVRNPNPKITEEFDTAIEPGKSWDAEITFKGVNGTNKATVEFSGIPSMGLEKRLDYLIQYPHGCVEQTTSAVFPQLYVMNLMDLPEAQKQKISEHVKAGIKRLQSFQTSNGGFAYWPGESYDSDWGTNYAGHFMIEAEKQGYALPLNLKNKWIKYQQTLARNWSPFPEGYAGQRSNESFQTIQAYRLFVLALCNQAELGAMNRLREEKNICATAKWRLAAAYHLVGQTEVAQALVKNLPTTVKAYKELSYSYGSETRDEAMILETLSLLKERDKAAPLAKQVSKKLNSKDWMSTQETAYSLLAMCEYADVKGGSHELKFSYNLNGSTEISKSSKKNVFQVKYKDGDITKKGLISMKNTGESTLFAKVIVEGVPLTGDKTASARDLKMEVVYKTMKGLIIQPDKLVQGTEFIAVVTISNPGTKGYLQEMTLNQIFPSGWEIHNSRMDETGTANAARYQDIRDDRVYSYYELTENTSKTFVIQLNATYIGRFYLPTVYSEAMYDHQINAKVPGRWVEVVKDGGVVVNK